MDLWIRSQDREQLVKVSFIEMSAVEHTEFNASVSTKSFCLSGGDSEFWCLGSYNTKGRALEVLDEIQNFLTPRFIVSTTSDNDCVDNLFDKLTAGKAFPDDKLEIKNIERDCWVYEMPKE